MPPQVGILAVTWNPHEFDELFGDAPTTDLVVYERELMDASRLESQLKELPCALRHSSTRAAVSLKPPLLLHRRCDTKPHGKEAQRRFEKFAKGPSHIVIISHTTAGHVMVCAGLLRGGSRVAVVPFRPRVVNKAEGQVTSQAGFFYITSDFNVFFAHQLPPEVSAGATDGSAEQSSPSPRPRVHSAPQKHSSKRRRPSEQDRLLEAMLSAGPAPKRPAKRRPAKNDVDVTAAGLQLKEKASPEKSESGNILKL